MSRREDLQRLITDHERRLQKRQEQKATFGISADPSIDIEIEDIQAVIKKLQAELTVLERRDDISTRTKVMASPMVSSLIAPAVTADKTRIGLRAQPRIFLCHANEDKSRVAQLYHQLKAAGYQPWLDKYDLLPGQDWWREIEKTIRNPYNLVLVCLSRNSVNKRGVVQRELKRALDMLEDMPEEAIYLIPTRLEPCETPERLSHLHWIDLFEPDSFEKLQQALDYEISKR